jgi:ATP-dependent DNA ligase/intein/homing endonuclease
MKYKELAELYEKIGETPGRLEKTEILAKFLAKIKQFPNIIYLLKGKIFPDYDSRETGISEQLAIKALAKSAGIDEKDVVKLWKKTGDLGEVAFSVQRRQKALFSKELTTEKVLENLRKLPELQGKGTVSKKLDLIAELFTSSSNLEAKYIIRTLLSDLRIGLGDGVLRDAIVQACLNKEDKEDFVLVQEAYDLLTDWSLVFKTAIRGRKQLEEVELIPGNPLKVMLFPKVQSVEEGFEVVGKPAACLPKGERILSNPSLKNIEQLKESESVIGKNGKFQKIIKVFERPYSGQIIKISPHYLLPFSITPEHRLLVVKRQLCSWKNRKLACRPNCQEQKYGCKKNYKDYKAEWSEAKNLEKNDFLLFPKFNEIEGIEKIDLFEYNKEKKLETKDNKIRSFSELKGTFKGNLINRYIKLSDDFFELMGWYLAEGNFDRSGIKFSLGYKENKEAERIKYLIKDVFGIEAKIRVRPSVIEVRAHSVLLINLFKENFGESSTNKKIPRFIIKAERNKIKVFLKAYIKGDGHKIKNNTYVISTASKNIAYQILLLLSKLNILPSVGEYKNRGLGDKIYKIAIYGKQIENIEKNSHKEKTSHQRYFGDENFFYIPIKKTTYKNYKGVVYNLETEDNTYLTSAIVHNCEYKYDGFRMLINKFDSKIKIFTRRLDEVTNQFPEVVEYIDKHVNGSSFILDAEAVGFNPNTKKYRPFQEISQRIKRKYDIASIQQKLPVEINVFDILYYNNKSLIKEPFKKRRELIEKIIKESKWKIVLAKQIITDNNERAEAFYKQALKEGEEGVMMKSLTGIYKPGARVGYGVKYKPEGNEFDLVITGAEYGTGKRAGWLTSYDIACRENDKLLDLGKVSTGLKEKAEEGFSFEDMTNLLKPLIKKTEGKHVIVKPEIVIMIAYQNIQASPSYSSGFALRFPRFLRLREDKKVSDIASLDEIKKEHARQTRNIQGLG